MAVLSCRDDSQIIDPFAQDEELSGGRNICCPGIHRNPFCPFGRCGCGVCVLRPRGCPDPWTSVDEYVKLFAMARDCSDRSAGWEVPIIIPRNVSPRLPATAIDP